MRRLALVLMTLSTVLAGGVCAADSHRPASSLYDPQVCQDPVRVIAIEPHVGILASGPFGKAPVYAVKYRQCGRLHQVLIEANDPTAPAAPLSLEPTVF